MDKILLNFEKNGFIAKYFENKEQATKFIIDGKKGKSITFGGSMTAKELGLYEKLACSNKVFDHSVDGVYNQTPDIYICSANAITKNGEIVNIDGRGNRVSATIYGPKDVYIICGINKICDDVEKAIFRAQNVAAPLNARRLNMQTPCAINADKCYDCNSPQRICKTTNILTKKPSGIDNFYILIINDSLGF